jgi:dihydrodipicolinate synthase/N-acetylneuraminate lyase
MPRRLEGVLAVAHTPFTDDDRIDAAALKAAVDWSFVVGATGLGTGMVSETLRLTADERVELPRLLVESAAGRGPVFAAVGAEGTRQAVAFAVAAERVGCDAVMAAPPLAARAGIDQLADYFRAIADAITIPVIVQDASGYVGQPIPIDVYTKLLDRYGPEKILVKPEAAPNGPNISALRDATGGAARIFEGSGGIFLVDSYRRGIAGTMPGMDLLDGVVTVWRALQAGDDRRAYNCFFPVCALVCLQLQAGLDGFLAVEKYLMVKRGLFPSARRRGPSAWELDPETAAEVDRLFDRLREAVSGAPA